MAGDAGLRALVVARPDERPLWLETGIPVLRLDPGEAAASEGRVDECVTPEARRHS